MNAKKKKRLLLGGVLLVGCIFAALAFAIPSLPHNFWGTVKDAGGTAIGNATISVKLNTATEATQITNSFTSSTGASATADASGNYDINLIMDDPDTPAPAVEGAKANDVVHIFINGSEAAETKGGTVVVSAGTSTQLYISLPDTTGPTASNVKADGSAALQIPQGQANIELTAALTDVGAGGKNIKAAEYFIGATDGASGAGTAMTAADGGFSSATENVTATVNTSLWTAANSPYTLRVHGQDDQDNWGATQTVNVTVYQAPAAPVLTNITSPTRNTQPQMSWTAVTGAPVYDLQVASDSGFNTVVLAKTGLTTTTYTPAVGEAAVDGTYYWRVRASDGAHAGPWAVSTALAIDTTPPAAVTGLTATPQASGDISLAWTNPEADFTGVIVLAKTDSAPALAPVNGTTYAVGSNDVVYVGSLNSYTDSLANNIHRYYKVFAYDALKNYSTVAATDATSSDTTPPAAATGFTAVAGDTKVTLAWTNSTATDFAGALVLYKQGSAPTGVPAAGTAYTVGGAVGDATVGYKGNATTTQITGLTNDVPCYFAIYAYDERPNYSTKASANATPVPFGITTPATATVDVKVGQQVAFAATGPSGSFNWTKTGGTLSAATGANVTWTAPATVTSSPTAYTVTLTDGVTPTLTDTRTINVYSGVSVTNKPATAPTIQPGASSTAFTASGADSNYTWTVTGGPVDVAGGSEATYTFTAPTTGAYAGEYTIMVADSLGLSTDSFKVKVPFAVTPASWNFKETDVAKTFAIGGAPATATGYTWDILASKTATTPVTTPAEYGAWSNGKSVTTPATTTNDFAPAAVTEVKTFYVQVTIADTGLAAAGLDKLVVGPFSVVPVVSYTVTVKNSAGVVAGASVKVDNPNATVVTGADGKAVFNMAATGGNYLYTVSKTGYVTQTKSSKDKEFTVTLVASDSSIAGTVTNGAGGPALLDAKVSAYLPATPTVQYTAMTDAAGAYTINLPTGAVATGWTVAAALTNYIAQAQTGIASGAAGVNFGLATMALGSPDVTTGGGDKNKTASGQTVDVVIPAGGVATNGYVAITQAAKISATANATSASPSFVYDVKVTSDQAGMVPLATADIKRITITLPVDLSVLKPGDLEKGVFTIYTAANQADLEAGKGAAVPLANIIETDYIGDGVIGSVTFWVDHLSFFGIGGGSGSSGSTSTSGCFIATAAYGSYFEKHVQILRNFRDSYMLTNDIGRAMVAFYYRTSPPIANYIAKHDTLRAVVRLGLAPIVGAAYLTVNTTPFQKMLILFVLIGIMAGGVAMTLRTRKFRRSIG